MCLKKLSGILIHQKVLSEMEEDEVSYFFFPCAEQRKTETFWTINEDHHIQITSHDRDYSNIHVHEQAMLSSKIKETHNEKEAHGKMLVHFFCDSSCV